MISAPINNPVEFKHIFIVICFLTCFLSKPLGGALLAVNLIALAVNTVNGFDSSVAFHQSPGQLLNGQNPEDYVAYGNYDQFSDYDADFQSQPAIPGSLAY